MIEMVERVALDIAAAKKEITSILWAFDRERDDAADVAEAILEIFEEIAVATRRRLQDCQSNCETEIEGSGRTEYPDRYVITALVAEGEHKGERVWLYWSPEGGGWWQWGPEGWARRFEEKAGAQYKDALACAPKVGPWYSRPDPDTIETVATPAIVKVY